MLETNPECRGPASRGREAGATGGHAMEKRRFAAGELALLAAIHDDPRNDRPRLDYADWLESHGLPGFAEFIRIQCREPYFVLDVGGNGDIRADVDIYWIKHENPDRANQAIELLRPLYRSPRFPPNSLFDQVIRGLPRYVDELNDEALDGGVFDRYPWLSPLGRFELSIRTARLGEWLIHPGLLPANSRRRTSSSWNDRP